MWTVYRDIKRECQVCVCIMNLSLFCNEKETRGEGVIQPQQLDFPQDPTYPV